MRHTIVALAGIIAFALMPSLVAAQSNEPSYRYNRVSAEYHIQRDGSVRVSELLTMLYDGTYHSMWRSVPFATSTTVSDVRVLDGATGEALTPSPIALHGDEPQSWGKYYIEKDEAGNTNVEWYYGINHRVHTWVLEYTLRGVITLYDDHDEFFWNIFANYDVPVDTVESQVFLPGAVTLPKSNIFSSGNHDWYIDRPDNKTFRFRVSDIAAGERVSIQVGWQKGLVAPKLAVPFTWRPQVRYVIVAVVCFGILALLYAAYRYRKTLSMWISNGQKSVTAFLTLQYKKIRLWIGR
jgi:hypothetical protein